MSSSFLISSFQCRWLDYFCNFFADKHDIRCILFGLYVGKGVKRNQSRKVEFRFLPHTNFWLRRLDFSWSKVDKSKVKLCIAIFNRCILFKKINCSDLVCRQHSTHYEDWSRKNEFNCAIGLFSMMAGQKCV